jgi:DNA-binding transcriptional regulator YbjK
MRQNPARRALLLDAAIEVLAREGARGLTFRAVDTEAAVPTGTASNYFANRDELLTQAGSRVFERLRPGAVTIADSMEGPRTRELLVQLMQQLVGRLTAFRSGYLALLELRLEATRRPQLRAILTRTIREDLDANISFHERSGMPGDATSVLLLYMALNWLIVDRLTLPDLVPDDQLPTLVREVVERIVPAQPPAPSPTS